MQEANDWEGAPKKYFSGLVLGVWKLGNWLHENFDFYCLLVKYKCVIYRIAYI